MTHFSTPVETDLAVGHFSSTHPKRRTWIWWLLGVVVVLILLFLWFAFAISDARELSNDAVREFHRQLNAEEYGNIWDASDERFKAAMAQDELFKLLRTVHKKLGNADLNTENLVNVNLTANTAGTFVVTKYKLSYQRGSAVETFTWVKSDGALKLYGYNVQSTALISE